MTRTRAALTLTALMVLAAFAPFAGAAQDDGDLSVDVTQSDAGDPATVTVTDNGTAAENASVTVGVGENATYDGTGIYSTDENGTVTLEAPNETVTVTVTVTLGNDSATTTATLAAETENSTDENVTDGNSTDGNSTDENVTDGNSTDDGETDLAFQERFQNFLVSNDFSSDHPRGIVVARWVVQNNPGNAPPHAGPKDGNHGQAEQAANGNETGRPEHAGPNSTGSSQSNGNGHGNGKAKGHGKQTDDTDDGTDDEETESIGARAVGDAF